MYKIGEFSKKTGVSVKTLRYYDEIGLLKPSNIDNFTNYRYYNEEELKLYKKIEYLKKIGFTLDEIKNNIHGISLDVLNSKKMELFAKRDYINFQILEIESLEKKMRSNKVMSLNR